MMHSWLYCTRALVDSPDLVLAEVGPDTGHDEGSPHQAEGHAYRGFALRQLGLSEQKDLMDFWI